jgi:hypothetical protein
LEFISPPPPTRRDVTTGIGFNLGARRLVCKEFSVAAYLSEDFALPSRRRHGSSKQAQHTRQVMAGISEMEQRLAEKFDATIKLLADTTLKELSEKLTRLDDVSTKLINIKKKQDEHRQIHELHSGQVRHLDEVVGAHAARADQTVRYDASSYNACSRPNGSSANTSTNQDTNSLLNLTTENESSVPRSCLPKMDFPRFDGSDVRVWLDQCESYFTLYSIPDYFRVFAVSLHLSGKASHWYQSYKEMFGQLDWTLFKKAVTEEFDISTHRDKMLELLTLRPTNSVGDFKQQFEDLVYHIRLFDKSISDTFLVTQFILGLKHEIRMLVEPYFPDSVPKAAGLALLQEKMLAKNTNAKPSNFRQHVSGKSDTATTPGELWKAKQLKNIDVLVLMDCVTSVVINIHPVISVSIGMWNACCIA